MRCLPFRVQPLPDEPLDSWLEAMAVAYRVPLRDILHAVGLCGELASPAWRGQSTFRRSWLYELADEQVARVSAATGVPAAEVQATTRLHFAACVTRRTPSGRVTALNAAGGQTGRFCPRVSRRIRRPVEAHLGIHLWIRVRSTRATTRR